VVVLSYDDKGKTIIVDLARKAPDGEKRKLYEHA